MPKQNITKGYYKLRFAIFERDKFACQLCGQTAPNARLEVDHIIPRSEGGNDTPDNLRTLCFACNRGRGSVLRIRAKESKYKFPSLCHSPETVETGLWEIWPDKAIKLD